MFFLRFRVVFENISIVISFLWYSKSSRNFHIMKSCTMFLSLIKTYKTKFFFADLCDRRNLLFIRSWNSIANSSIAKWFSKRINEYNWNLKIVENIIFANVLSMLQSKFIDINRSIEFNVLTFAHFLCFHLHVIYLEQRNSK